MHGFAAAAALMAFVLYCDRSGWLYHHGTQSRWALVARGGVAGLLASIFIGFVQLASDHEPFVTRHWLALGALVLTIAGHVGLRRGGPSDPT